MTYVIDDVIIDTCIVFPLSVVDVPDLHTFSVLGDKRSLINPNHLYKFVSNSTSNVYYVRVCELAFWAPNTTFYNVQWNSDYVPPIGDYTVTRSKTTRLPVYGRTLGMIGDSITGLGFAAYFRQLLRDKGTQYEFSGLYLDPFAYGHTGIGGACTATLVNSVNCIPTAEYYHILLGTNDLGYGISPDTTVVFIKSLAAKLYARAPCTIFVSTLLSRTDSTVNQNNVIAINNKIVAASWLPYIRIINLNALLSGVTNWGNYLFDGLHPTLAGYELITDKLAVELNKV